MDGQSDFQLYFEDVDDLLPLTVYLTNHIRM